MAAAFELFFWVKVAPRTRSVQSRTIIWCLGHDDGTRAPRHVTVTMGPSEPPAAGSGKDDYVVTTYTLDEREYSREQARAWIETEPGRAFSDGALVCSLHSISVATPGVPPVRPIGTLNS